MWPEPKPWWHRLFPLPCCLCHLNSNNRYNLCAYCAESLPWQQQTCRTCALTLTPQASSSLCGACLKRPPPIDYLHAAFNYEPPLLQLIYQFKFGRSLDIGLVLTRALYHALQKKRLDTLPDCLIPMPLHKKRLRERGYNQAVEIAKPLGRWLHIPVKLHACRRIKATAPQTLIATKDRKANLKGAFAVVQKLPPHVAIIDDVYTSGSTALELARTLRRAGVLHVDIWVLARAGLRQ